MVALVIFLLFSVVSGHAILIAALHMSLYTDLFAIISFKNRKT